MKVPNFYNSSRFNVEDSACYYFYREGQNSKQFICVSTAHPLTLPSPQAMTV